MYISKHCHQIIIYTMVVFAATLVGFPEPSHGTDCRPIDIKDIPRPQTTYSRPRLSVVYDANAQTTPGTLDGSLLGEVVTVVNSDCSSQESEDSEQSEPTRRHPLGDTVFARHPGLLGQIPESAKKHFVAAEIARTTRVAVEILSIIVNGDYTDVIKYRAAIEIVYRITRTSDTFTRHDLETWIDTARSLAPTGFKIDVSTDIDFLEAVFCNRSLSPFPLCKASIDSAIEKDPYFIAARRLRIDMLGKRLMRSDIRTRPISYCETILAELLLDISNVVNGIDKSIGKILVGDTLASLANSNNPILFIGAAHAYNRAGLSVKSSQILDNAQARLNGTNKCWALMSQHIAEFRRSIDE